MEPQFDPVCSCFITQSPRGRFLVTLSVREMGGGVDSFVFCFLSLYSFRGNSVFCPVFSCQHSGNRDFISLFSFLKINVLNDIKMCICNWSDLTVKTVALKREIKSNCLPLCLRVTRGRWARPFLCRCRGAQGEAGPAWKTRRDSGSAWKRLQTSNASQTRCRAPGAGDR